MKKFWALLALAAALAITPAVKADSYTLYFNFGGAGNSGGGSLTGTWLSHGVFDVTGGNFKIDGMNASVVVNPNAPGTSNLGAWAGYQFTYDDLLMGCCGRSQMDVNGLLFAFGDGGYLNIWEQGGVYYYNAIVNGQWVFDPTVGVGGEELDFDISCTPEPSSLVLLGSGLLFLAGFVFWKSRNGAAKPNLAQAV